ncbi:MAG: hypothetical protein L0922_03830, partial [Candidatus Mariimomonas ferrooxydans]
MLQETPSGLHYNVLAQGGYNNLNDYFGNYKLLGEVSNRFFDDKLGVFLSLNTERVNRGVETMSATYELEAAEVDILLSSVRLNKIERINSRKSATLKLDYQLHPTTKLKLYGLYTNTDRDYYSQTKSYSIEGTGNASYGQTDNTDRIEDMLHITLSGETKMDFLNTILDYGATYSFSNLDNPTTRNWTWGWQDEAWNVTTTREQRRLDPLVMIPMFDDHPDSLHNTGMGAFSVRDETMKDDNLQAFLNIRIPYKISDVLSGYVKFGGKYRVKNRSRDITAGSQGLSAPYIQDYIPDALTWIQPQGITGTRIPMLGLEDKKVEDYLGGEYDYGWWFRYDRLNQITDWWTNTSDSLYAGGQEVWGQYFFTRHHMGYKQNLQACMIDDQDITETYVAGYLMAELNIGKWIMVMPGVRYETTNADMKGAYGREPFNPDPTFFPLPIQDTSATRSDAFLLPMVHLRIKPTNSMYVHLAYTQTLSRPDFNAISPNSSTLPQPSL